MTSGRHPYSPSEMWGKEVMISRVIPLSCSVQNVERHFPPTTPKTPFPDRQQATTPVPGFGYSYVASQEGRTPAQLAWIPIAGIDLRICRASGGGAEV